MQTFISRYISITGKSIFLHGKLLLNNGNVNWNMEDIYRQLQINYPKFFKMDVLCKWAIIGAECLLKENDLYVYEDIDKTKIAVVLMTSSGCLDVDKKYLASTETIASPALFVYTLPNIMLGEICIKHGFKGEQLCMMNEAPDAEELFFWVNDLLQNRNVDACLCGWIDAAEEKQEAYFIWVDKKKGAVFTKENLALCLKK